MVSNFGGSGEIHARKRKWAPLRRRHQNLDLICGTSPCDASSREPIFAHSRVYFAGIAKCKDYLLTVSSSTTPLLQTAFHCIHFLHCECKVPLPQGLPFSRSFSHFKLCRQEHLYFFREVNTTHSRFSKSPSDIQS